MSRWVKVLSILLTIATLAVIFPPKIEARSPLEGVDPRMAGLGKNSLSLALGLVNPALGSVFSTAEAGDKDGSAPQRIMTEPPDSLSPPLGFAGSQPDSGLDLEALIAASPECSKEGLLLVTRQNTWSAHPSGHDEMVRCVEEESAREDGWSGPEWSAELITQATFTGKIKPIPLIMKLFFTLR